MRKIEVIDKASLRIADKRVARFRRTRRKGRGASSPVVAYKTIGEPFINRFMKKVSQHSKNGCYKEVNGKVKFKTPTSFCFITNPDESLSFLFNVSRAMNSSNVSEIEFNHRNTKNYGLGAEAFLGILAKRYKFLRKKAGSPLERISGIKGKNDEHNALLNQIGIIDELDAKDNNKPKDMSHIHLFKKQCFLKGQSSKTGDDDKTKTAEAFVEHIQKCLRDHNLTLKPEARDSFKGTLGEVLDNAEEHCASNAPRWYVRGYVNNGCANKMLELTVFNFGASIAQTFEKLPDSHFSKDTIRSYVEKHIKEFDRERLTTVAALQLRVSSKNLSIEDDRGQGTIKLIELFEGLYKEYKKKRPVIYEGIDDALCEMSILSGNVCLKFDGTYELTKSNNADGRIVLPFNNDEGGLNSPPDSHYVTRMEKSFFPGVCINIRVPMLRNIEDIDKGKDNE